MAGPGAHGCVASRWPDEFGEDRFFEFGEDRYLCDLAQTHKSDLAQTQIWREMT